MAKQNNPKNQDNQKQRGTKKKHPPYSPPSTFTTEYESGAFAPEPSVVTTTVLNPLGAGSVGVTGTTGADVVAVQPVDLVTVRKLRGMMSATAFAGAGAGADAGGETSPGWWSGASAAREFWMANSRTTQATLWQLKGRGDDVGGKGELLDGGCAGGQDRAWTRGREGRGSKGLFVWSGRLGRPLGLRGGRPVGRLVGMK